MIISCYRGSRADTPGIDAIAEALTARGVAVTAHDFYGIAYENNKPDAVVILGDRQECAAEAVLCRGANVPIAHIHAGEISGQEPDDTYRNVISHMSKWLFAPHDNCYPCKPPSYVKKIFVLGSPFITSAHNTELVDVKWPDGEGKKVFVAFNPLPENPAETEEMSDKLYSLLYANNYRFVAISPNTDRHADRILVDHHTENVTPVTSLTHAEYLSYMASADAIIGNSSSMIIEASVYGTPAVSVGSRQFCREHPPHVRWCRPKDMGDMLLEALAMEKIPSEVYGTKDSAGLIAEAIIEEVGKL